MGDTEQRTAPPGRGRAGDRGPPEEKLTAEGTHWAAGLGPQT